MKPVNSSIVEATGDVNISWTEPSSDGGSNVTGYVVKFLLWDVFYYAFREARSVCDGRSPTAIANKSCVVPMKFFIDGGYGVGDAIRV